MICVQCSGYMSLEYAMEGRFSEKSDIYSLRVLILEIVSGRKKGGFHDGCLSLLSYVRKQKNHVFSYIWFKSKILFNFLFFII